MKIITTVLAATLLCLSFQAKALFMPTDYQSVSIDSDSDSNDVGC